ncbi:MAG: DUF3237 family protein [Alphaproteobacteria bacterium]|jgi:hypothetical protein|nr:DUF3237 family protein [Alphaproteobacteria bacterium]
MTHPLAPPLTYLMSFSVEVGAVSAIIDGTTGRRFVPIRGGEIAGRLMGRILEGGGDWQTVRADGTIDLEAHYIVELYGHGLVEVSASGVRCATPDGIYFRTSMRFSTEAPGLAWMSRRLFLSTGRREASNVALDIFEVG